MHSDLVNASASALQDDDLQQFGSVTLRVLAGVYGQHLQQAKVRNADQVDTRQQN